MTNRMSVVIACAAAMLLSVGCKKAGEGPPPGKGDGATKTSQPPGKGEPNNGPMLAPAPPPGTTCFSSCIRQYAMRAVGADQNDRDCRARCDRECVDPCKQKSAARAVSADQINADCRSSCGL